MCYYVQVRASTLYVRLLIDCVIAVLKRPSLCQDVTEALKYPMLVVRHRTCFTDSYLISLTSISLTQTARCV